MLQLRLKLLVLVLADLGEGADEPSQLVERVLPYRICRLVRAIRVEGDPDEERQAGRKDERRVWGYASEVRRVSLTATTVDDPPLLETRGQKAYEVTSSR